jgi:hypothetical protein
MPTRQNILHEIEQMIRQSQKEYQSELDRNSDRAEYWRGKIDGFFAVKTLLQLEPDDDSEPAYIDLSDAIEPQDRPLDKISSKLDVMIGAFAMLHITAAGVTA